MPTYTGTNGRDIFDGSNRAETVYGRAGDDDLYGYGGSDILYGEAGRDLLIGGAGADKLYGGADSDLLDGGTGSDLLDGGDGFDYIDYLYAGDGVVVDLSRGLATRDGDGGRDTLAAIEGVYGSQHADRLIGDAGTNELFGRAGNDILTGGAGQDLTVGGAGADRFVFNDGDVSATLAQADLIGDFRHAERDRIDLRGLDANSALAGDQAFTFVGQAAFSGTAGELRFAFQNGETVLTGDTNGDAVADVFLRVSDQTTLVKADFLL